MTNKATTAAVSPAQIRKLRDKFPEKEIEWRIGRAGFSRNGKPWGFALAYVTNRAIMNRLDDVIGPGNWKNEFLDFTAGEKRGVLCGISIRVNGEWITKWDGAEPTQIEPFKGALSDSMKRAACQWGIGRYLYELDEGFLKVIQSERPETREGWKRGSAKYDGQFTDFFWQVPKLRPEFLPEPTNNVSPSE